MTNIDKRHEYILAQLGKEGYVRVEDLAASLGVTGATIRKDLRILESRHALLRNHGSASPVVRKVIDLPVQEKSGIQTTQKNRIAHAACSLIAEEDAIILTSGSTIEAFATALRPRGPLNVVTPSLRVGLLLSEKDNISTLMLGGKIIRKSLSVRDAYTMDGLKNVKCSKLFFSCDGLDETSGITTAFVEEARMTAAMIEAASQVILLADSSKIGKVGFGKICDLTDIDILITDKGIAPSVRNAFETAGVKVILA